MRINLPKIMAVVCLTTIIEVIIIIVSPQFTDPKVEMKFGGASMISLDNTLLAEKNTLDDIELNYSLNLGHYQSIGWTNVVGTTTKYKIDSYVRPDGTKGYITTYMQPSGQTKVFTVGGEAQYYDHDWTDPIVSSSTHKIINVF